MKPIFTVLKRQLASSSIPLALALLVMLLATSSASSPTALSRGNYAWLPAAAAPFFLVILQLYQAALPGGLQKSVLSGHTCLLRRAGAGHVACEHAGPACDRPAEPYPGCHQPDGRMRMVAERPRSGRSTAVRLSAGMHAVPAHPALYAGVLVRMAGRRHSHRRHQYFHAPLPRCAACWAAFSGP